MSGSPEPHALLELAVEVAERAGAMLAERFAGGTEHALAAKTTPTDLVSEADLASEREIRRLLEEHRPDDAFIGEEGDDVHGTSGLRWIVDPLDGTINFLFGVPQWSVSIAVADAHGTIAGVVCDPIAGETFAARRGEQPTLGGRALAPSRAASELSTALVATGFAYDARVRAQQGEVLTGLLGRVRDIRRFGSAALDLAWTAAGRYDAYFERSVKPWDIAAGVLLCECAGLELRELAATETLPSGVLAAAPGIVDELYGLVG